MASTTAVAGTTSQGGRAATNDAAVMTAHNPGTVSAPAAATAGSTRAIAVADTITFTVPAGESEQVEFFAAGTPVLALQGCEGGHPKAEGASQPSPSPSTELRLSR
jgi:hypothetical protein